MVAPQGVHSLSAALRSRGIGTQKRAAFRGGFLFANWLGLIRVHLIMSSAFEQERLARWMRNGEILDPRNDEDYDTWDVGMEPIPGDKKWANKKAPEGLED
jgi:hypothetical protein